MESTFNVMDACWFFHNGELTSGMVIEKVDRTILREEYADYKHLYAVREKTQYKVRNTKGTYDLTAERMYKRKEDAARQLQKVIKECRK